MTVELKVPEIGESITEVEIGDWLKKKGESVRRDESVVTLESEKATVDLPAPDSGKLGEILKQKGETAKVGEVIGYLTDDGTASPKQTSGGNDAETKSMPKTETPAAGAKAQATREEVSQKVEAPAQPRPEMVEAPSPAPSGPAASADRQEEVVPMSRLRRTVAERLVEAQRTAALLTTFNEIDMTEVLLLRKEFGETFQLKYQAKLGFMSFFVKACVEGLKQFPALNAEVRGTNIVYHNYFDIGVAVGSGKGLVVPVLRNAERMSFAEIETAIGAFARRAKENKLKVEELQGGTFTLSNGGVYGSLLSTPIINPPQSGVLGLHAIQERPVAREGNVVIRSMMYVALTYDHRIVDGREAVTFLKRIKDVMEKPARLLMEI
jgi:2-oxoglutarate dehydrogenase E2 component (dihydrolipoamide succinyltransferase)